MALKAQVVSENKAQESWKNIDKKNDKSVFKNLDQVQGQGFQQIESGAYTLVREHFNLLDNAAIGT